MLSYHNDPAVKEKFVLRFAAHRAADEVVQGQGFEENRGCFVGCTLDNYDHGQFPKELGWPEWLAHLADAIFEGIPESEAAQFGTDLLATVPVGVDLEPVRFHIAITRHKRQLMRLQTNTEPYAVQCVAALEAVIAWCNLELSAFSSENNSVRSEAESVARLAACSAANLEAYSAVDSAYSARSARSAVLSAAYLTANSAYPAKNSANSIACSADSAAYSAAADLIPDSAAYSAANLAEYKIERDTLLHVLQNM